MNDIKNAFSELEPDKETADRIYNNILSSSYAPAFRSVKKKKIKMTKRNLTIVACASILVAGTIVSTCSALVLNVQKKNKPEPTTELQTETMHDIRESVQTETSSTSELKKETSLSETNETSAATKKTTANTSAPAETQTNKAEKITVNGRDYIVVTTEPTSKPDGRLHASNKDIIVPKVTEKTEKVTEKKTEKTTVAKTTARSSAATSHTKKATTVNSSKEEPTASTVKATAATPIVTEATKKTEEMKKTEPTEETIIVTSTVAETAAVTTTFAASTSKDVSEPSATESTTDGVDMTESTETSQPNIENPWDYTIVTYNGQEYHFNGYEIGDEQIQHYLGLYKIYSSDLMRYVTKDTFFIDDNTVAVEFSSVRYIYTRENY